jgi:hypothetical protein
MTTNSPVAGWDPVALYQENIQLLGERDIAVAGDPGAGNALVGNIVLELGFEYLDPYTESVTDDGSPAPEQSQLSYRRRMSATSVRDKTAVLAPAGPDGHRFIKTHMPPDRFDGVPLGGALLLVRDPRDTIYSGYKWFRGFSESWWENAESTKNKSTFADFLHGTRIGDGRTPVAGWTAFYEQWLDAAPDLDRFAVVRFEDLKTSPVATVTAMLATFGLTAPVDRIERAVALSSFDVMRSHEDTMVAADGDTRTQNARIMRRGRIGEWQEWIDGQGIAEQFTDPDLIATAARFGYDLSTTTLAGTGREAL